MICIGVTGGIGSGKSIVCRIFQKKNIPVFFSDTVAANILTTNNDVKNEIITIFGREIVEKSSNLIDRKKLAKKVFHDPQKLEILNSIAHPKVFEEFDQWKKTLSPNSHYCLAESALLFESGMDEFVDYVLAITADEEVRIKRTIDRMSIQREEVISRIKNQLSSETIAELSDFELINNASLEDLSNKVGFFHIIFSTLKPRKERE